MLTLIEQALFFDGTAHWVSAFELSAEAMLLTLHPSQAPARLCQVRFVSPRILSTETYAEGEMDFPWDIIGFDCEQLADGIWRFCLHTDLVEYVFAASWPQIKKA